jgi:hypothetical protein
LRGEVIEGEAVEGAEAPAAKPAPVVPKKKMPIGGFRRQPLQVPHPAYAVAPDNQAGAGGKDSKKGAKKLETPAPKSAAPSRKAVDHPASPKRVTAAPKARESSKPEEKKIAKKKAAA